MCDYKVRIMVVQERKSCRKSSGGAWTEEGKCVDSQKNEQCKELNCSFLGNDSEQ